ncbi:MAG: pyridoxamine 5'-phosphate oxidase family protein [Rikenellaceae bacterium]
MDRRIKRFLKAHKVMTLGVVLDGGSWSAPLFYAFDEERGRLIFTSSSSSAHICGALANPCVSVGIVGRSGSVARLRGAQIVGVLKDCSQLSAEYAECRKIFLRRFPFAARRLDDLWYVEIASIKYTDNRLGFGTKLFYNSKV